MPIDAYTGEAIVPKIDIEPWGLITDKHLDAACKKYNVDTILLKGKVLCLNTGMHRLFDDSKAYYHYAAGAGIDAGKWFVKHGLKYVAMGGHVRVGMEDNVMYARGVLAASNRQFVERAVRVVREFGREPATPDEARGLLGLAK